MLPNFICLGAEKAGTTTLHEILKNHSEIYLPECKETHFFSKIYKENAANHFLYESKFFASANHKAVGEFTPSYLTSDIVAKRIYDTLGKDLKLIICLRQPVDRAFSAYRMYKDAFFDTSESFEEALERDKEIDYKYFKYLQRGLYGKWVSEYLKYFPKENIMFVVFEEDIKKNIDKTVYRILDFLDVSTDFEFDSDVKANSATDSFCEVLAEDYILNREKPTKRKRLLKKFKILNKIFGKTKNKYIEIIPKGSVRYSIRGYDSQYIIRPSKQTIKELATYQKYEKPSKELRAELTQKHFMEDIRLMEDISGLDLSIWYK